MSRIIKLSEGDDVPEGAEFIESVQEPDYSKTVSCWGPAKGIRGIIPFFGVETLYRDTPIKTFFYYKIPN